MKKIIVIGSPGAGKSTFARKLQAVTRLPLYYLDLLWHRKDQTNVSATAFDGALEKILATDEWIIDGNYLRTMERRLAVCDTIFLLDYPLDVCLDGAQARIGKKRVDLPWVETEFDEEFRQWILSFPTEQLPQIYQLLAKYGENKKVIIFKTRTAAERYLRELAEQ